jgi:hypothetical protein
MEEVKAELLVAAIRFHHGEFRPKGIARVAIGELAT